MPERIRKREAAHRDRSIALGELIPVPPARPTMRFQRFGT
jgi:hypothetical protein